MSIDTLAATVREQFAHLGPFRGAAGDEALAALVEHARTLELEVAALKQQVANRSAIIVRLERVIDTLQAQRAAATSQIAAASDSRARLHDRFEAAEERIATLEGLLADAMDFIEAAICGCRPTNDPPFECWRCVLLARFESLGKETTDE